MKSEYEIVLPLLSRKVPGSKVLSHSLRSSTYHTHTHTHTEAQATQAKPASIHGRVHGCERAQQKTLYLHETHAHLLLAECHLNGCAVVIAAPHEALPVLVNGCEVLTGLLAC